MKTFDKLKIRVKKDLDIDIENIHRLYVGHWQRSKGAWVWASNDVDGLTAYGSTESATELLKSKKPLILWDSYAGYEIMSDNN